MNGKPMKAKGYGIRITGTFPMVPSAGLHLRAVGLANSRAKH